MELIFASIIVVLYCIACTVSSSSRPVVVDQLHHCSAAITTNPTTSIYLHSLTPFLYPFHSIINLIAKSSSSPFLFFSSSLTLSSSLYPLLSPRHILLFYLPTSFFFFFRICSNFEDERIRSEIFSRNTLPGRP